jgi:hypothetical protein
MTDISWHLELPYRVRQAMKAARVKACATIAQIMLSDPFSLLEQIKKKADVQEQHGFSS